jgi:toxin ParE1/3/4
LKKLLEIVWGPLAATRLIEIRAYISLDKPAAAERLATRIVALAESIRLNPNLGHPTGERGTRELIVGGTPYSILYSVRKRQILIRSIHHAAQPML